MKANKIFFALLAGGMLVWTGCDNDDNYVPDEAVVTAFNTRYPDAKRVEWESKKGFRVADFMLDAKETEAWFDTNGNWLLTETDLLFSELPTDVQTEFVVSLYGTWRVEDVDVLTRPDAAMVYVIEVEKGEQEVDIYYTEDGTLLREVTDDHGGGYEPSALP